MKFFYMGGPLFMGILTFVLIAMVAWAIYHLFPVLTGKEINVSKTRSRLKRIKTIGSFAGVFGVLGQLIGLYQAFGYIEKSGPVSIDVLSGGLKVSMIPTIYGILIFLSSLFLWFILDYVVTQKSE